MLFVCLQQIVKDLLVRIDDVRQLYTKRRESLQSLIDRKNRKGSGVSLHLKMPSAAKTSASSTKTSPPVANTPSPVSSPLPTAGPPRRSISFNGVAAVDEEAGSTEPKKWRSLFSSKVSRVGKTSLYYVCWLHSLQLNLR